MLCLLPCAHLKSRSNTGKNWRQKKRKRDPKPATDKNDLTTTISRTPSLLTIRSNFPFAPTVLAEAQCAQGGGGGGGGGGVGGGTECVVTRRQMRDIVSPRDASSKIRLLLAPERTSWTDGRQMHCRQKKKLGGGEDEGRFREIGRVPNKNCCYIHSYQRRCSQNRMHTIRERKSHLNEYGVADEGRVGGGEAAEDRLLRRLPRKKKHRPFYGPPMFLALRNARKKGLRRKRGKEEFST